MPRSSARPRIRACMAARVPSACHRCNQRGVALFDPQWGPCGRSHQRQPVIKMYNKVFSIFRNGACGIPRLRCSGAGGKTSSHKRHSTSLTPSNRPAILPSYVQIEQYSTKIILVGYIHIGFEHTFRSLRFQDKFSDKLTRTPATRLLIVKGCIAVKGYVAMGKTLNMPQLPTPP